MKTSAKMAVLAFAMLFLLVPVLTACDNGNENGGGGVDKLVIYNWEDYIDTSILDDFAAYYQDVTGRSLDITYTTYDTNETMMTKVLKGDANVDLICPSEYAIEKLMLAGKLINQQTLMEELKPQTDALGYTYDNLSNVEPAIMDVISSMFGAIEYDDKTYDMTQYMVPYMWGTLGILYNTRVVSEEELEQYGWGVLWNAQNNAELEGKILMKDSVRDSYAAAVLYMSEYGLLPKGYGYEALSVQELINHTDDALLDAAEKVLAEQRPHISGYEVDFGKDDMINEIVYADLAWSGDALWAIEEGGYDEETDTYQLGYYVPESGSNIWYDGWAVPDCVENKLAAMMFIDYMCAPISGARNSMEIGYTSSVSKEILMNDADVTAFIEENEYDLEEYFGDTGRYPEITDKMGVMRDYGARNEVVVQMWQKAKAGGKLSETLYWVLLGLGAIGGIIAGAYFLKEGLKRNPKKIGGSPEKAQA
jgi:spermidine/putrescine transport system substrate-binding protein